MSLLNQASLIQIPSGYKDGTLYSAKPINGDGDLDFTRSNDTATRVNSDGLIEKVRTNLLLQSNSFDTTWVNVTTSETGGQSGYDGSSNAWIITLTGGTATKLITQTTSTLSGVYTASFYAKQGTHSIVQIGTSNQSNIFVCFDLSDGSVGSLSSNAINAKATSLGNGWYRIEVAFLGTNANGISISGVDSISSTRFQATSSTGNFYIQDAQLETGDIATDYIPTTSAAVSVGMTANVPRLDYTGGGCGKLLLEPQRTNVCLWSEQINNAGWGLTNSPTITTNIATAPDGYEGADGIQDTTGGTFKRIRQSTSVSANSTNTASVFVKKETIQTNFGGLALTYTGGTAKFAYAIINPVDGTIVVSSDSVIGATSTKAEDYGNWWRFSLTATDNGGNTNLEIAYYATLSTNGTSTGVGAGSVRTIWGFQLEIGATYATSYIPTLAAAVTRGADVCNKTGIGALIGGTSGTVFFDIKTNPVLSSSNYKQFCYYFDSASAQSYMYLGSTNLITTNLNWGSLSGATPFVANTRYKIALVFAPNDFALYVNGVSVATASSGTPKDNVNISIGQLTGSEMCEFVFNQYTHFPSRLTNDELADLTTI